MYQQYWLPGSKGYLVHTGYIPSVVEWIVFLMAKFGVPWFPETKAALWQIMILWQSRPCTVWYQQYRLPGSKGYLVHTGYIPSVVQWIVAYISKFVVPWSRNESVPLAYCDFMTILTLHCMYQQYRLPGSKGYLVHTGYISSVVEWIVAYMAKFGMPWFPETKESLWQIVILWQSRPCTVCTSNIGSRGQRAIWYT